MTEAQQPITPDERPSCFVIMPISAQTGYDPEHFSLVYDDIIKPAIELAGMKSIRADETQNTNLIQLDILRKVIDSDIAICDMSAKNPNVFYELGMRQAFDKPTVLMIDDSTAAPFDVSSLRYVTYSRGMKYRDVRLAITKLSETLKETYAKRTDKTEINSLIRLMELTSPAQLTPNELSSEVKTQVLHEIQYAELMNAIKGVQRGQKIILTEMDFMRSSVADNYDNKSINVSLSKNLDFDNLDERNKKYFVSKDNGNRKIPI